MNRCYKESGQMLTRGVIAPIVMDLPIDLTGWDVTFTMRSSIADLGEPLFQCTNQDLIHMKIKGNRCTVTLSESETWAIPEKAPKVFIQLNFKRQMEANATFVYALSVGPNIMEVAQAR